MRLPAEFVSHMHVHTVHVYVHCTLYGQKGQRGMLSITILSNQLLAKYLLLKFLLLGNRQYM